MLIVAEYLLVAHCLQWVIERAADFVVCGQAGKGREALRAMRSCRADVVLVNIEPDLVTGLVFVDCLARRWPSVPIVVVSCQDESCYARPARGAGAKRYLSLNRPPDDVLAALRQLVREDSHSEGWTTSAQGC